MVMGMQGETAMRAELRGAAVLAAAAAVPVAAPLACTAVVAWCLCVAARTSDERRATAHYPHYPVYGNGGIQGDNFEGRRDE